MQRVARLFIGSQRGFGVLRRPRHAIRPFSSTSVDLKRTIKEILPALWVRKMKTLFALMDSNGDGMITEEDFQTTPLRVAASFGMTDETRQKKYEVQFLEWWTHHHHQGKELSPGYQMSESMFIESVFQMVSAPGCELLFADEFRKFFAHFDLDNDGVCEAKQDVIRSFEATPLGGVAGLVSYTSIDTDHDGKITCDEFVAAGMDFFFNFVDETKPSKYFYGPLKEL